MQQSAVGSLQDAFNRTLSGAARKSDSELCQRIAVRLVSQVGKLVGGEHIGTAKLATGTDFAYPLSDGYWSQIHGGYEPELSGLLCDLCRNNETIFVDGGANRGYFSTLLAALATKVVAIEPNDDLADWVERNLASNDLQGQVVRKALWNEAGLTLDFSSHQRLHAGGGVSSVAPAVQAKASSAWESFKVVTTTVDEELRSVTSSRSSDPLLLLKLDVEGAELQALRGGQQAMDTRPCLIFYEQHPLAPQRGAYEYLAKQGCRQLLLLDDRTIELRSFDDLKPYFKRWKSRGLNIAAARRASIAQRALDLSLANCGQRTL